MKNYKNYNFVISERPKDWPKNWYQYYNYYFIIHRKLSILIHDTWFSYWKNYYFDLGSTYILEDQIQHKVDFLQEYIDTQTR